MSSRRCPLLPSELLFAIIDDLKHEKDLETLKSCALVCRGFHDFCQSALFADIHLQLDPRDVSCLPEAHIRLNDVLGWNTEAGAFVRSLTLELCEECGEQSWSPTDPSRIVSILLALKDLRHLEVRSKIGSHEYWDWEDFSPFFDGALRAMVRQSKVQSFNILGIRSVPSSLFSIFTSLEDFFLSDVDNIITEIGDSPTAVEPGKPKRIRLRSLETYLFLDMEEFNALFLNPNAVFDLHDVRDLYVQEVEREIFDGIIAECIQSVQHLRLDFFPLFTVGGPPFSWASMTSLVSLTMFVNGSFIGYDESPAQALSETIMSIPPSPSFRKVEIFFKHFLDTLRFVPHYYSTIITPFLHAVDTHLTLFPSLEAVIVHFNVGLESGDENYDWLSSDMKTAFALASRRNLLDVHIEH